MVIKVALAVATRVPHVGWRRGRQRSGKPDGEVDPSTGLRRLPKPALIDAHVVYAGVLLYLTAKSAGHVRGLDGGIGKHPGLRPLVT